MNDSKSRLRVWPAIVILVLMWGVLLGLPRLALETMLHFQGVPLTLLGGTVLFGVWWVFLSRASRRSRWGGAGLFVAGLIALFALSHESMQVAIVLYILPRILTALTLLALLMNAVPKLRTVRVGVVVMLAIMALPLMLRTAPLDGDMQPDFSFRWSSTPVVATIDTPTTPTETEPLIASDGDWTEFRGPQRDSQVHQRIVGTNWNDDPPVELWRTPVGEAWSSMTIVGDFLFTQEQRGDRELVTAYRAATGEPLWADGIQSRFFDPISGAGPRGTPTFADGRLFSITGRGTVLAHDASRGTLLWSHDLMAEYDTPLPDWGFSGSPEIYNDTVIVCVGHPDGVGLAAYDAATGDERWTTEPLTDSYSAPHLVTLHDTPQVIILHGDGVNSHDPVNGSLLWRHDWPVPGTRIVQPALVPGNRLLIGTSFGEGTRLLQIDYDGTSWSTDELWTSRGMKPYYNDFAVYDGHLYGFDTKILSSIDLADGSRDWKRGRYGHGQLLMLADQGVMLVLSEQGDLALVEANPDEFIELARVEVLSGKTWNHPAIVGDVLYVRNDREMAAYRLPRNASTTRP